MIAGVGPRMARRSSLQRATSVYFIRSLDNGGVYVGVTVDPKKRWREHCKTAKSNTHVSRSLRKYGPDRHEFSVEETYPTYQEALEAEVWWIAYLRGIGARVFNLTDGGDGGCGVVHTPEAREKQSIAMRGHPVSEHTRAQVAAANRRRTFSAETRAKMSALLKGRKFTPEHCAKIAASSLGHSVSEEARAKIGAASKGRKHSAETRARLSEIVRARNAARGAQ